jgi:putative spermidine/putrescine transport system ATP-binding protein
MNHQTATEVAGPAVTARAAAVETEATAMPGAAAASSRTGAAIRLQGIRRSYGAFVAIRNLDLDIRAGEFISLLGPSGSGKSTTLMLIAGFERPDAGRLFLDGRDVTRTQPHRRGLGMVFQNYALFPHMTVAENIAFALKQRGVGPSERAVHVARALDLVRLPGLGDRYPQQLSGGQQQRVAIARAVVFDPPVLLMDEPLSALDKQLREEMQFEVKRLHQRLGITFVYVTHDQREALVMSDRVAVMNAGAIAQLDTPEGLYDRPVDRFVATFVGDANFLKVEAARDGMVQVSGHWLRAAQGAGPSVMVRPEKIGFGPAVGSAEGAGGVVNVIPGQVLETIFMGDQLRCLVTVAPGQVMVVKQQHRTALPVPEPGEQVQLNWAVADTLLI